MDERVRATLKRLRLLAEMMADDTGFLVEEAGPETLGRIFGGGSPSHLEADLGALIANIDRLLSQEAAP